MERGIEQSSSSLPGPSSGAGEGGASSVKAPAEHRRSPDHLLLEACAAVSALLGWLVWAGLRMILHNAVFASVTPQACK